MVTTQSDVKTEIIRLRVENPCFTLQDIATQVNRTPERVMQILKKENLPTRHYTQKDIYTCLQCGNQFTSRKAHKFCSMECYYQYSKVYVECSECHQLFKIRKSELLVRERRHGKNKNESIYCSQQCYWKWRGRNYGMGRNNTDKVETLEKRIAELERWVKSHLHTPSGAAY